MNAEVDEDEEDEVDYDYGLDELGCNNWGGIIVDEYELLHPGATDPILSSIDPGIVISSLIAALFPSFPLSWMFSSVGSPLI